MTSPLAGKKNLVFLRVGDRSTHREWIGDPATRSYDVWLDYYEEGDPSKWSDDPALLTVGPGTTKYARAHALLPELSRYEAVWFPDDDISVGPAGVERLFETFHALGMLLAQPSLADPSYVSHEITRWNGAFEVRYTNFVEAMCPLFSREALLACAPSFSLSVSAFGLDMIWSRMLRDPRDRIGMIDAAPVVHTRPIGAGTWRRPAGFDPIADRDRVLGAFGVGWPFKFRVYGGVPRADGAGRPPVLPGGLRFLARMTSGVPRSVRFQRRYWSRTLKSVWRGRA
ncbi:MAG TPA: hypothetical protein VFL83_19105 [Anaeromyxobacter sp.]|nr:hypothetical protein [Anaeromyxobacter sp.]